MRSDTVFKYLLNNVVSNLIQVSQLKVMQLDYRPLLLDYLNAKYSETVQLNVIFQVY